MFAVVRSVSKFIYRANYQLVICMRMKRVFTGVELDGQPECRISFLAKILVQDSVILLFCHTCATTISRFYFYDTD